MTGSRKFGEHRAALRHLFIRGCSIQLKTPHADFFRASSRIVSVRRQPLGSSPIYDILSLSWIRERGAWQAGHEVGEGKEPKHNATLTSGCDEGSNGSIRGLIQATWIGGCPFHFHSRDMRPLSNERIRKAAPPSRSPDIGGACLLGRSGGSFARMECEARGRQALRSFLNCHRQQEGEEKREKSCPAGLNGGCGYRLASACIGCATRKEGTLRVINNRGNLEISMDASRVNRFEVARIFQVSADLHPSSPELHSSRVRYRTSSVLTPPRLTLSPPSPSDDQPKQRAHS
ncbi:hypothetical protein N658DRAFT_358547 [Parathielavia hyrcaniae]|uniref:Uncharacterized protein n=1 Tax=Parathielavia hyrcaniae TaxID=113614 RepID=A0AAN6Q3R6_9PEZI|nr:hypothetical protein N658DRAFT_358547 [Parathielavia hyrcaniae]